MIKRKILACLLIISVFLGNTMSVSAIAATVSGNEIGEIDEEGIEAQEDGIDKKQLYLTKTTGDVVTEIGFYSSFAEVKDAMEADEKSADSYSVCMTEDMLLADNSLNNKDVLVELDLNGYTLQIEGDVVITAYMGVGASKSGTVSITGNVQHAGNMTVPKLVLQNGCLAVDTLTVEEEMIADTDSCLYLSGKGSLADITVTGGSREGFLIGLLSGIEDTNGGSLEFAGSLTNLSGTDYAVLVEKYNCNNDVWETEEFVTGETVAFVTSDKDTFDENNICIGQEGFFVERNENLLLAACAEPEIDETEESETDEETESETEENVEPEVVEEAAEETVEEIFFAGGINADGEVIEEKGFGKWSSAIAYLNENGKNGECVIEVMQSVDIEEKLKLPGKAKSFLIRGGDKNEDIALTYIGDINLSSNTTLENIQLSAKKMNNTTGEYEEYASTLTTNEKSMMLIGVIANFGLIEGSAKTVITMESSDITVQKAVTALGTLHMTDASLAADSVTVTKELYMQSARLDCAKKMTLNNIISESSDNVLAYGGNNEKNILTIKGSVYSENDTEEIIPIENEEKSIIVRKNALTLEPAIAKQSGYERGMVLCNATKAAASWFVVGSTWGPSESGMLRKSVTYGTYKNNKTILCGESEENVNLYSSKAEDGTYLFEGGFTTLQEAFTEIDKLAVKTNYYRVELMKADKDIVTFTNKGLVFPSKTAKVMVTAVKSKEEALVEPIIYFKGDLELKSDIVFDEIIFVPKKNAGILLGDYSLTLSKCYVNPENASVGFNKVTGSGVKKNSELILDDTSLQVFGGVNNVGKIVFTGTDYEPSRRVFKDKTGLVANGAINIGDVQLDRDADLAGVATITRKKSGGKKIVTQIASKITINGNVFSNNNSTLCLDLYEKTEKECRLLDFDSIEMRDMEKKGIQMAKAPLVTYPNIKAVQRDNVNSLIKSAGKLIYYPDLHGVELEYTTGGENVMIPCLTFADAVTEINNQKVKRDYTITLTEAINEISGVDQNSASFVPKELKMPAAKNINSLVLQADVTEERLLLGYINNITFTCDTVVRDINFVQMVNVKNRYKTADEAKKEYPKAVTVNTGGYTLKPEGIVTFNTPIVLNGKEKSVLTLDGEGTIVTLTNQYNEPVAEENVIYGKMTGFKELNVNQCNLTIKEYKNSASSTTYKASENKVGNLNLIGGNITVTGEKAKGSFEVSQTATIDSGKLVVGGRVTVKDVITEGNFSPTIFADYDFVITGKLTSKSNNTTLLTRLKGKGKAPYLNIKGNVVCGDYRPVYVGVYPENSAKEKDKPVKLKNAPKVTAQLLTANKAPAEVFRPIEENTSGLGEYDSVTNPSGYWVGKVNSKVYVYEGKKE